MKTFLAFVLLLTIAGTCQSVKLSVSAKAHQHVENFLASLQPYINEKVDARSAWPWPEDSYEMEQDNVKADMELIEESSGTGSASGASASAVAATAPTGATGSDDETGGATGGDDETGVSATASTGTTGSSGTTGSTGATGATAETGSTGATGEQEPEKPKEPKDATIQFDIAVVGVTREQILSQNGMKTFRQVVASKIPAISADDVNIGSAEKQDPSNPIAKAHAEAKAKKEAQLKKLTKLAEETTTGEKPETTSPEVAKKEKEAASVTASEDSAANKDKPNTVLIEVGAGAVDVRFIVSNVEASKAEAVGSDVAAFIADDSDDGFAKSCQRKGLKITGAKLNREPAIEGGKPKAGCAKAVMKRLTEMKDANRPESDVPAAMRTFCRKSFNDRKNVLPASLSPTVIARTCERAFTIFNRRPVGKRYEAAVPESREYCYEMRQFFEYLIRKNGVTNMKHGLATSVSEINREQPGQGITACCVPHQSGGCYDKKPSKNIQECVCKGGAFSHHPGKQDKFCCDTEWDLTCAENVEWYGCAACPQPEFLFR